MKRLFSILLAEVLYLAAIVCRWCIVITHFVSYLYTGFFVFMLFFAFYWNSQGVRSLYFNGLYS